MISYIESADLLSHIVELLQGGTTYVAIRKRCDDHLHYNFYKYLLLNDNEIHQDRLGPLDEMASDVEDIFLQHFAFLFSVSPHYMSSSDYLDALELGMTPEEDSQYFVAPFIQKMFDKAIKLKNSGLAAALKQHTSMHLE